MFFININFTFLQTLTADDTHGRRTIKEIVRFLTLKIQIQQIGPSHHFSELPKSVYNALMKFTVHPSNGASIFSLALGTRCTESPPNFPLMTLQLSIYTETKFSRGKLHCSKISLTTLTFVDAWLFKTCPLFKW